MWMILRWYFGVSLIGSSERIKNQQRKVWISVHYQATARENLTKSPPLAALCG